MSSEFALSPPRKRPMELLRLVGWAVALAFLVWSWRGAEMRPMTLITESGNILTLIKDFFPPDFTDWRLYATEMVVTLQVAIWGTLLAVVCAVPLGILSSDNIVPWWVYHPVRRLMDAARAINEMVFAMLFVVAVGLGPFAGVLALWVPPACVPAVDLLFAVPLRVQRALRHRRGHGRRGRHRHGAVGADPQLRL